MTHTASGKSAPYGSLAVAAAKMPVPDPKSLKLKTRAEYRLIGKRYHGVDDPKVVSGQPLFGIGKGRRPRPDLWHLVPGARIGG
ncbi:MAG: hypothetical protein WDN49_21925 [Acetobacteraceae bacterium]